MNALVNALAPWSLSSGRSGATATTSRCTFVATLITRHRGMSSSILIESVSRE
jgi:hypothetical protein